MITPALFSVKHPWYLEGWFVACAPCVRARCGGRVTRAARRYAKRERKRLGDEAQYVVAHMGGGGGCGGWVGGGARRATGEEGEEQDEEDSNDPYDSDFVSAWAPAAAAGVPPVGARSHMTCLLQELDPPPIDAFEAVKKRGMRGIQVRYPAAARARV